MGFSLTDIQTVVRDWEQSQSAPRMMVKMRDVYRKKLAEARDQIRRLQDLERENPGEPRLPRHLRHLRSGAPAPRVSLM